MIRQRTGDDNYNTDDIQWVLTVPAIWTPKAKQFMREAAYEVSHGIHSNFNFIMIIMILIIIMLM